jgi:cyclophilin family peptidyl-prolyl cis-trans isomerase
MRFSLLAVLVGALLLVGCGSDSEKEQKADGDSARNRSTPTVTATATPTATATETPSAAETVPAEDGCQSVDKPEPKSGKAAKPTGTLDASKTYTAVVKTSCGEFSIELDVKRAPKTTGSFVSLARAGFLDDTTFHRIVPGFVIQGGDPAGNGTGGPGYTIVEAPPKTLKYTPGIVAMAKGGAEPPGASGSQFFVVTGSGVALPPDYALLGKVTEGEDTVQAIATASTDPNTEQPIDPIVIESVTIEEK